MSCHSSGSLEGGYPSSTEVIKDNLSDFKGLYSLFFLFRSLRDFLFHYGLVDFQRFLKYRFEQIIYSMIERLL